MGTTRIKIIDLSGEKEQIKTSRKHAEKLTGVAKIKATGPEGASPNRKFSGTGGLTRREEKKTKGKKAPGDKKGLEAPSQPSKPSESSQPTEPSALSVPSIPSQQPVKVEKKIVTGKITSHRHLGRKYLEAKAAIDNQKQYTDQEAIELLYKTSTTHFDPTVEVHLNVTEKNMRGKINFPHLVVSEKTGKTLVFSDKKVEGIKNVIWGDEQTVEEISAGNLKPNRDFTKVISTPKFMPSLAKIAKILGPADLMPNPKAGTITDDIVATLKSQDTGGFEYKTDPNAAIIHTKLGRLSYKPDQLRDNLKTLISTIGPAKIKKATVSSTMGPPIKIDLLAFAQKT